ncbi:UPF0481 protein At3g47200-like [Juglans microcarpa x Juglans regia]|uniref:UPF0481 protein At3g47200-like n=1 Tax=Juglans microcarpa x Juglans regia TaxID=2249226 RepID=UPI001B7E390E|nr:UPF0481 protein At3g47200-like [Juglans microcarpa x Juglans regia]
MAGESETTFQDVDANTSFIENLEHRGTKLSDEITRMLESLEPLPESPGCCIYKVPDPIRNSNEEAYTPQIISIGPFHHGSQKLQTMEKFKLRYLKSFKERSQIIDLEDLVSSIRGVEESVRECYSETIPFGSDDFVKMILLDASFIIEFFLKKWSKSWTSHDAKILKPWYWGRLQLDLMLLENQLPFFVIHKIYDTALSSSSIYPSFIDLVIHQFGYTDVQIIEDPNIVMQITHFLHLHRSYICQDSERQTERSPGIIQEMHSATQLAEVGIKFMAYSGDLSQSDIKLVGRVMEIPRFKLDKNTEIYARNLIAFEQCHFPSAAYITDYYFLLRLLIRSQRDVDLLVREKIIVDWVDDIDATSVLNKILENIDCSWMNVNYRHLAEDQTNSMKPA